MKNLYLVFLFSILTTFAAATTHIHRPSAMGKEYYIVFPKSAWGNQSVGVLINSPSKQKISVFAPGNAATKGTIDIKKAKTTQYYNGNFRTENIPGYHRKEATHIVATDPVSVHGQFGLGGISGTYTAMPVTSWDTSYYVAAPPEGTNTGYYYFPTVYSVPMVTIIASLPGTVVTINPTVTLSTGQAAGVPFTTNLATAGDVYNISTRGDPLAQEFHFEDPCHADLSGTHISSNYPIGVIVAQTHSSWPCGDNECGDYAVEWLPPVSTWDSLYVITPSVPRLAGAQGEALRIVFAHDGTDLIVDDGLSAPRTIGTFAAGQVLDYANPIGSAIVMWGSHPFLPLEITRKPNGCFVGNSGGENWTLSMAFITGVNQWADYVPFSTAIGSASSTANVWFRYADRAKIRLNGKPLIETNPVVNILPQGFATMPIPVNAGQYSELTGDSGATAGGVIYGFGTLRFAPGGGSRNYIQDPEVIKCFGHAIGMPLFRQTSDSIPPRISIVQTCGHWNITVIDSIDDQRGQGIFDISIVNSFKPDTSFNVAFSTYPVYAIGQQQVSFGIDVVNTTLPSQVALRVTDGGGNDIDTVLTYNPQKISTTPDTMSLGAVEVKTSKSTSMTLKNASTDPYTVFSYRLAYGASRHWQIKAPAPPMPFTLAPGDSMKFTFQYDAPDVTALEYDNDTLKITSCREFPLATLSAWQMLPGILTECYDFGDALIDTLGIPGDTTSSFASPLGQPGVYVTNIGSKELLVTGLNIVGKKNPFEPNFPLSDFTIGRMRHGTTTLALPTPQQPWKIAPLDTCWVEVFAHPHRSGIRNAAIKFDNNASNVPQDSACLAVKGLIPGIVVTPLNFGTMLYATTADSFFVVKNVSHSAVSIRNGGIVYDSLGDSDVFVMRDYRDPTSRGMVHYDSTVDLDLDTSGFGFDTARIPYRFVARKVGVNATRFHVLNNSTDIPTTTLRGTVVQPRLSAGSACPPDSFRVGEAAQVEMVVWNDGTDVMQVENIDIGGDRASEWSVQKVEILDDGLNISAPPWSFPLQANGSVRDHRAIVTLKWIPTSLDRPATQIHLVGHDRLGRHSADSASGTFYQWNAFPYDTTLSIIGTPCISGVNNRDAIMPKQNILWPNYPNPFSSSTTLSYTIATPGVVELRVRNILGEVVETVLRDRRSEGTYSVQFTGDKLCGGVYVVEMVSGTSRGVEKIVVMK